MAYIQDSRGHVFETENLSYWSDCTKLSNAKGKALLAEQSAAELREILKPSDVVYTVLRHVSSSGMSRAIDLFVIQDGRPRCITVHASNVTGYRISRKHRGLEMGGCGMDMGFQAVYSLGRALWPNGTDKPHGTRNGEPDSNGGYALKHEWL